MSSVFFRSVLAGLVALWLSGCGKNVEGSRGSLGGFNKPGESSSESGNSRYRSPRNNGTARTRQPRKPDVKSAPVDLKANRDAVLSETVERSLKEKQDICVRVKGRLSADSTVRVYNGECKSVKETDPVVFELSVIAPVGVVHNDSKKVFTLVDKSGSKPLNAGLIEENYISHTRSLVLAVPASLTFGIVQLCTGEFQCKLEFDRNDHLTGLSAK